MLITNRTVSNQIKVITVCCGLMVGSAAAAAETNVVQDLKDSHKPALNYPQSVEWAKKRRFDNLYALRASDVIGRTVFNGVGDELGKVDDILMPSDVSTFKIQVVIEVGGFLGMGGRLIAVPYSMLRLDPSNVEHVYYNATRKQLDSLTEFVYETGEETGKSIYSRSLSKK